MWNVSRRLQGRTDTALSDEGVRQAQKTAGALDAVARQFGYDRWDALYSSPLKRALQTAEAIGDVIGVRPAVAGGLVERSFGILEGWTREEADQRFPDWHDEGAHIKGMETRSALESRALQTVAQIGRRHEGQAVIAVTHGAFLRAFFSTVDSRRLSAELSFSNCGYSLVTLRDDEEWRVMDVNVIDHL